MAFLSATVDTPIGVRINPPIAAQKCTVTDDTAATTAELDMQGFVKVAGSVQPGESPASRGIAGRGGGPVRSGGFRRCSWLLRVCGTG